MGPPQFAGGDPYGAAPMEIVGQTRDQWIEFQVIDKAPASPTSTCRTSSSTSASPASARAALAPPPLGQMPSPRLANGDRAARVDRRSEEIRAPAPRHSSGNREGVADRARLIGQRRVT